ncbi:MAG: Fic family protein [Bacilli bacterium]|nr:Fic family protein [Bacilli bacterium]
MYSYKPLEKRLIANGLHKSDLTKKLGISSRTIAKMSKGEKIADHTLNRIAEFLHCRIGDLFTLVYENPILQVLKEEKESRVSGGLYHELQVRMTYTSNHMEGSRLSEEQTRWIFETRTIDAEGGASIDDIIETSNHFRCIDFVIETALEPLSEEIIKRLHLLLKQGTKDSFSDWFAVGDYKKRPNAVGEVETAPPHEVPKAMKELMAAYLTKPNIVFEDIVRFHAEFEFIHPFQDGNGRVGRLIALKECLRFNIAPFLIEDKKKLFYYRGLAKWKQEKSWLIETCLDGQDTFKKLLKMFGIQEG